MTGNVTWDVLIWLGGTLMTVGGTAWQILVWVLGQMKTRDKEIAAAHAAVEAVRTQLHKYEAHVAETYATKSGMAEQTDRIMKAISDLGNRLETRVDGLGARLDRFYEGQPRGSRE